MTVIVCVVGLDGWALATDSHATGYRLKGDDGAKWKRYDKRLIATSGAVVAADEMGWAWKIGDPAHPRAVAKTLRDLHIVEADDAVPFSAICIDGDDVAVWHERWARPDEFPWLRLGDYRVAAIGSGAEAALGAAAAIAWDEGIRTARAMVNAAADAACLVAEGCSGRVHSIDSRMVAQ